MIRRIGSRSTLLEPAPGRSRGDSFDPRTDAIVREEALRLRTRLEPSRLAALPTEHARALRHGCSNVCRHIHAFEGTSDGV
jgi:hypothetical protein